MNEIGKRIKERRLKKGLSQEELAEQAKVNLRTVQRIENNETTPRRKTLDLIFEVLDIEVIEQDKPPVNKYLIGSLFLTSLIFAGTFLGWIRRFKMFSHGERIYRTSTGWSGYSFLNDYHFQNWLLSISCISVGVVVIGNSLGLIKYKIRYVLVQTVCLMLYLIGFFGWGHRQAIEMRPGLFIISVATILLISVYRKNGKQTLAEKEKA